MWLNSKVIHTLHPLCLKAWHYQNKKSMTLSKKKKKKHDIIYFLFLFWYDDYALVTQRNKLSQCSMSVCACGSQDAAELYSFFADFLSVISTLWCTEQQCTALWAPHTQVAIQFCHCSVEGIHRQHVNEWMQLCLMLFMDTRVWISI